MYSDWIKLVVRNIQFEYIEIRKTGITCHIVVIFFAASMPPYVLVDMEGVLCFRIQFECIQIE